MPVPTLRKRPGPRRLRLTTKGRHARRLPKGLKPTRPGEIVQIDTLFVNVRPDKPIKQITAYDPVARWTVGRVANSASARSATALLDKLLLEAPFMVTGVQSLPPRKRGWTAGPSSGPSSRKPARRGGSRSSSSRPSGLSSTAPSSEPRDHGVTSSTAASTCLTASTSSRSTSTPSPTASTTTGHTRPLADKPQPSTSHPSAPDNPPRLICAEPGH